jgi:hypothetical protein
MSQNDEHRLWTIGSLECVMVTCCAGAELQVRTGETVLLRELYPSKSDLYERARQLEAVYHGYGGSAP